MEGQRRQEVQKTKPDVWQENAFLITKERQGPQTVVSQEKCSQVRQRACKHGDVPSSKIWYAKISVLTYFNKFFDSFFHILLSVLG